MKRIYGRLRFAWVSSNRLKFREREDGREGCIGQVAEDQPGSKERGPSLRAEAGGDGQANTLAKSFYALDDPLEAAVFSVLVEMICELD